MDKENVRTPACRIDDAGIDLLAVSIIRQAAMDYWHDCVPGKYSRGKMSKEAYEKFCADEEMKRKRRKKEERSFFTGELFRLLCHDQSITGEKMMKQLEFLRTHGRKLHFADPAFDSCVA